MLTQVDYTPIQLRLPLVFDEYIKFGDPVYTFEEIINNVNLNKYIKKEKNDNRGRKGYNPLSLLKVILFAFQLKGYASTREIEDLCYNDIRFRYLLQYETGFPSHMTIDNFMKNSLKYKIDDIFHEVNGYIFNKDKIDLNHIYIDGTKIEANANKYSWVWKKACITSRDRMFIKISSLLESMNKDIKFESYRYDIKNTYEIEDLECILNDYQAKNKIDTTLFVHGKGKRKTIAQRNYEELVSYLARLKDYAIKIDTCGEHRNSFSKTDKDATFMRMKKDYMGNDQLLPAYNVQFGIADEYIAVYDINQYASDMDCFVPLMEKFNKTYNKYPLYPIADAGYGSYNNYIYCEEHNMKKYMKFPMYKKETEDAKYHNNKFRAINFKRDENNNLICPNGKKFVFKYYAPIKGNKYGRKDEVYECENCNRCKLKKQCTKAKGNRKIRLNKELTSMYKEVIDNLESIQGALLRMNRSIQSEGAFGILKQDRFYRRIVRKGLDNVNLELGIIACSYNIYKYHNKKHRKSIEC